MVNRQHMTAALIDSRDFLAAKRRAETEVMLPRAPRSPSPVGPDFNDHRLIWGKLDQVRTKHPDMVLLHGEAPWAQNSSLPNGPMPGVTQVAQAGLDQARQGAPFKRNDAMLDILPVGASLFSRETASRRTSPTKPRSWASQL